MGSSVSRGSVCHSHRPTQMVVRLVTAPGHHRFRFVCGPEGSLDRSEVPRENLRCIRPMIVETSVPSSYRASPAAYSSGLFVPTAAQGFPAPVVGTSPPCWL